MTAGAAWAMSNAQLPLPNMDTDACKTTTCPVKIGNRQTYTYNLHISPVYPPVSVEQRCRIGVDLNWFFFVSLSAQLQRQVDTDRATILHVHPIPHQDR